MSKTAGTGYPTLQAVLFIQVFAFFLHGDL